MNSNHSGAESPVSISEPIAPEVFQRVWNRVMPDQTLSPVEVVPPPPIAAAPAAAGAWQEDKDSAHEKAPQSIRPENQISCESCRAKSHPWQSQPDPLSPHLPAQDTPFHWQPARPALAPAANADTRRMPPPGGKDEGRICLGCDSMGHMLMLEEMMDDLRGELAAYQALSCRAPGRLGRSLSALCEEIRGNLRQLGAVYFLLTGCRYQPQQCAVPLCRDTLATALRRQFMREQCWTGRFASAAAETGDPCLRELFEQLEQEAAGRTRRIRILVEQLHT